MDPRFFVSLNSSWRRRNGPFNGDRWEDTKVPWQRQGPKVDVLHMSRVFWRILRLCRSPEVSGYRVHSSVGRHGRYAGVRDR